MVGDSIKVTLSTASVFPRRTAYAFELASRAGYDGMEIMVWTDTVTQNATKLRNLSDRYGLPITSIHAPSLVVSQNVWGAFPARKLEKSVELAEQVGAPTVVVHPPFMWQPRYAAVFQTHVKRLMAQTNITIAVENMYPWRYKERERLAYLPHWDLRTQNYDAVTVDLSHASTSRQDSLSLVQELGDTVRHIHLADGKGGNHDEHLVPGLGTQPVRQVIEHLVHRDWSGDLCVEIGTRKADNADHREAMVCEALEFARSAIKGATPPPMPVAQFETEHSRPTDAWH